MSEGFAWVDICGFDVCPGYGDNQVKIRKDGMSCYHRYDPFGHHDMGYEELMAYAFSDFVSCASFGQLSYKQYCQHITWGMTERERANSWRHCRASLSKLRKLLRRAPKDFISSFVSNMD